MAEYNQLQEWAGYGSLNQVPLRQEPTYRGEPHEEGLVSGQGPSKQGTQKERVPAGGGMIGSMYPHVTRGIAPSGGGEPPPLGGRGLPEDKPEDESDDEEGEESETDEETVSVTSSSQASAEKMKQPKWNKEKEIYESGAGGPPEDPNNPLRGGSSGDPHRGPRGHRGQRERTKPPGRDGVPRPMGPIGPRGFPGRDGLSTTIGPLSSTGLGALLVFNANLSTIGMKNSIHYLGESLNHVMQFQQNVNQNMVEHLNMMV